MAVADGTLDAVFERESHYFTERTPRSREAHERALRVMPGGTTRSSVVYPPYPATVARGAGIVIEDLDGNRYLDFLLNYTALILGHAHPDVVRAATAAIAGGSAVAAPVLSQIELAEELQRRIPSADLVRFTNSGTEANMMALRAARAFTGKNWVLKIEGGYHGTLPDLDAAIRNGYAPPGTAPSQRTRAVPFNDTAAMANAAAALDGDLAAIILEPVMGNPGLIPPLPHYLREVRDIADRTGALLIFDEVITFRLSPGGYGARAGVVSDLVTLGKIIGGGFPVGAVAGRADVMAMLDTRVNHAGTFNGNAVTTAAGLTTLRCLDDTAYDTLASLGARLARGLAAAIEASGVRACVTHVGSLVNVHFTDGPILDAAAARPIDPLPGRIFHLGLLNRGINIAPRGLFNIALVTDGEAVDRAVAAAASVFALLAEAGQRPERILGMDVPLQKES